MKSILMVVMFLLITQLNSAISQRLTVNEMFDMLNKNIDDIDTELLKKGYVFKPQKDSKNEETQKNCPVFYEYAHKTIQYYSFAIYECIYDDYKTNITVRTSLESDYLKFKDEIKISGFKHVESYVSNETNFIKYEYIEDGIIYQAVLTSRSLNSALSIYEICISEK